MQLRGGRARRALGLAGAIALGLMPAMSVVPRALASGVGGGASSSTPAEAYACGAPAAGFARCHAIQLLQPSANWHPGPTHSSPAATSAPSSGYYPSDLQSAYGLGAAVANMSTTRSPTIAVVDAYDDPNALSDLTNYRTALSGATDPNTGLSDGAIPPICTSNTQTGCVQFTKMDENGGSSFPRADNGWAEEISLDLDMVSAICPACNITLVEAASNSYSDLVTAVNRAKGLNPAAVTNSYGGGEFSSETSYNGTYSSTSGTAVTAATGDSGYGSEFPAVVPSTTAVGGTSLSYSGTGSSLTWNAQSVWYTSSTSAAGAGCSSYEAMPTWQQLPGVYYSSGVCGGRQEGDIAAVADPYTGVAVYDTYGTQTGWSVFGGTSASTQIIGAMYGLAAGGGSSILTAPSSLYSDTTANGLKGPNPNLVPVTSGSDGSCGGTYLCTAGTSALSSKYNGPTGLGTPSGLGAFTGAPPSPDFSVSVAPSSQTVTAGGSGVNYTITVTPVGGWSGTVNLAVSGLSASQFNVSSPAPLTVPQGSTSAVQESLTTSALSGTTASSYPFTVTGTSGSLSHTGNATLVVQAQGGGSLSVSLSAGNWYKSGPNYKVNLTAVVTAGGSGVSGDSVTFNIYSGSCGPSGAVKATGTNTTGTNGSTGVTFSSRSASTWCAVAVAAASGGYTSGTSNAVTFNT